MSYEKTKLKRKKINHDDLITISNTLFHSLKTPNATLERDTHKHRNTNKNFYQTKTQCQWRTEKSSSSSSSLQTEVPLETYTNAPTRLKVDLVSKTSLKRHHIFPTHRPHLQRNKWEETLWKRWTGDHKYLI